MSVPSPRVRCGPVELRLVTPRSAQQLYAMAREPELSMQLQWPAHRGVDDSLEFIHHARELWQRGTAWLPGIFDREREQLVGCTGLNTIDRVNRRAEIGTWIGLPYQGQGFYRPARAALATFAFRELGLARLELLVRVDNPRSLAAARSLPRVREEGVLAQRIDTRGELHDAVLFALMADEFDPAEWPEVIVDPGEQE